MEGAIGALEFNSIARGVAAADAMLKAAAVSMWAARTVCPGKYLALVCGDVSSVQAAVAAGEDAAPGSIVDRFVIPNVHPDVFPALTGTSAVGEMGAAGVLETYSALTGILAGDAAAKAASVKLVEIRLANGIGGKAVLTVTGNVAEVEAAVRAGEEAIAHTGLFVASAVIPSPHPELKRMLV